MLKLLNPFILGVLRRSAVLGGLGIIACSLIWDVSIAWALACGVCMGMVNLVLTSWLVRLMLERAADGSGASAVGLSFIFLLKLLSLSI